MRHLIDTNVLLELIFQGRHFAKCKSFIEQNDNFYITDFAVNSAGVMLFRNNEFILWKAFLQFVEPFEIISLSNSEKQKLISVSLQMKLDYDDAYQWLAAKNNGCALVTLDKDFSKTKSNVEIINPHKISRKQK